MEELIEALNIFNKYSTTRYPTHCMYDTLLVLVDYEQVSDEDIARLDQLGFHPDYDGEYGGNCFYSFRYGSA